MKLSENRYSVEKTEKWLELCKEIPGINFRDEWEVKIMPPRSGALARFNVEHNDVTCSVFLDWFEDSALGLGAKPGWDVHTVSCGQPERFELWDVASVRGCIESKLEIAYLYENKEGILSDAVEIKNHLTTGNSGVTEFEIASVISNLLTLIKISED